MVFPSKMGTDQVQLNQNPTPELENFELFHWKNVFYDAPVSLKLGKCGKHELKKKIFQASAM